MASRLKYTGQLRDNPNDFQARRMIAKIDEQASHTYSIDKSA